MSTGYGGATLYPVSAQGPERSPTVFRRRRLTSGDDLRQGCGAYDNRLSGLHCFARARTPGVPPRDQFLQRDECDFARRSCFIPVAWELATGGVSAGGKDAPDCSVALQTRKRRAGHSSRLRQPCACLPAAKRVGAGGIGETQGDRTHRGKAQ